MMYVGDRKVRYKMPFRKSTTFNSLQCVIIGTMYDKIMPIKNRIVITEASSELKYIMIDSPISTVRIPMKNEAALKPDSAQSMLTVELRNRQPNMNSMKMFSSALAG